MRYLVKFLIIISAISCDTKTMQEKIDNQCDLDQIRSIKNGNISFYEVSESKSELVNKPVEQVSELIISCKNDSIFPKEIGQLINLKSLAVGGGNFDEFPFEIGNLKSLEQLILINTSLKRLPAELYKIPKLKQVTIMYNLGEFEFGEELCQSENNLEITHTSTKLKQLPDCVKNSNRIKLINKEAH